ncbi:DUF2283 domain-containing protein [Wenzhouxiangella sp. XN201]|uniref:DUF2283 domain-containing protein n=1 Tax=Wenzhouxiangella sp. XN201 TaxID=2710755 RepID=UPI0013CBA26B|nr:DUF2283 domain-containing protein [Wenzhouxiangella sp. XN201]NEZ04914.1 DUF2283 domain-containing protein [Wenzhouxiangella sp. XN201]
MRVQYFEDTDTLYIEFRESDIAETRDLDENTLLELDEAGNVCALTFEHASKRTDIEHVTLEGIAA